MIQRLRSLSGLQRRLALGFVWLAVALYTLAPAMPRQFMPQYMPMAGAMAGMSMPADCPMDMSGHGKDGKTNTDDCPICKVAATAALLTAPPALPPIKPDVESRVVASLWLPPSQAILAAQPRGPPPQA